MSEVNYVITVALVSPSPMLMHQSAPLVMETRSIPVRVARIRQSDASAWVCPARLVVVVLLFCALAPTTSLSHVLVGVLLLFWCVVYVYVSVWVWDFVLRRFFFGPTHVEPKKVRKFACISSCFVWQKTAICECVRELSSTYTRKKRQQF